MLRRRELGVEGGLQVGQVGGGPCGCLGTVEGRERTGSIVRRAQQVAGFQQAFQLIGSDQGHITALAATNHDHLAIGHDTIHQGLE
jgi:hypothetical protein